MACEYIKDLADGVYKEEGSHCVFLFGDGSVPRAGHRGLKQFCLPKEPSFFISLYILLAKRTFILHAYQVYNEITCSGRFQSWSASLSWRQWILSLNLTGWFLLTKKDCRYLGPIMCCLTYCEIKVNFWSKALKSTQLNVAIDTVSFLNCVW